ncbi:glycosyltransferase (plasmid) [Tistrella bauzanensis]|uniref:CgeB family protein n=1 Tax=Tistrella TaxID=171436 RepID=UPI0031F694E3
MKFVLFSHSVVSCWNHGNAHFQRGIVRELSARGHEVVVLEPADGWSRTNLVASQGPEAVARFHDTFPEIRAVSYTGPADIDPMLDGADVVIVHEWTDPALVADLGRRRIAGAPFLLLFHDTHHRAVSAPHEMAALDLDGYDAVLAFGAVLAETWRRHGWGRNVHVWHEAADLRLFGPRPDSRPDHDRHRRDLVWIGNWGDGERGAELDEFLVEPVRALALTATIHGVRYPDPVRQALARAGIDYAGWIANADVPRAFARHRMTVHVPRRFYATDLPGIPTIRMFEALASGIPLVSAPWTDTEGLFRTGTDYLTADTGPRMRQQIRRILADRDLAADLAARGRETILARHGCNHRVDQLLKILSGLAPHRFDAGHLDAGHHDAAHHDAGHQDAREVAE